MYRTPLCAALLLGGTGCSFLLNFDNDQIPKDAQIDGLFTQELCTYKEPNNSAGEAAIVTTADVGPAATCPLDDAGTDDHDFYRFTVPAMTASVNVKINFPNRGDKGDLDLKLYDINGTLFGQSRGILQEESITCPGTAPPCSALPEGDYVFEVFPTPGSMNDYTMALTITPM